MRDHLLAASAMSFLFWCNAFVWTYRQKAATQDGTEVTVTGAAANTPFITWPVQDECANEVEACIESGQDINVEKSRDMGATWLLLAIADWMFLFRSNVNIGVVSRKEDLVDSKGDMDSLFEKVRYIHRMVPTWMLPPIHDRYMHLNNTELSSTIAGESTNSNVGRGGRKTFYFVDEAAAIPNAHDIESSLSQNTVCQVWVSTPKGPLTCFHERIREGRGRRIQLPWYRHPEKAISAHQVVTDNGKISWTSPWYERLAEKYSRKTVAQEVDMDHGQAGDLFFEAAEVERHREDHQSPPAAIGNLTWTEEMPEKDRVELLQQMDPSKILFVPGVKKSPWRFWFDLEDGRPPQYWTYAVGVDISNGAGNSNSVISIAARETGRIVAKWWDAFTSPEELAVVAAMAGVWFGGAAPPAFICWENNGPGGIFGRKLVKMGYPNYYQQRPEGTKKDKRTPRWGWNSNPASKEVLLGRYRDALSQDDLINPCRESLDEMLDYIYSGNQIIPARLREESSGGRALHGDHVIADGLTVLALEELPRQRMHKARGIYGTYAFRKEQARRKAIQKEPW